MKPSQVFYTVKFYENWFALIIKNTIKKLSIINQCTVFTVHYTVPTSTPSAAGEWIRLPCISKSDKWTHRNPFSLPILYWTA